MNKKDALELTRLAEDITQPYRRLLQFATKQRDSFVPEWCHLPLKYVRRYSFDEQSCTNADILVGAYTWLESKACFTFDQTLYDSLLVKFRFKSNGYICICYSRAIHMLHIKSIYGSMFVSFSGYSEIERRSV